jgi:hypothetical protein
VLELEPLAAFGPDSAPVDVPVAGSPAAPPFAPSAGASGFEAFLVEVERSFFAQPEPLKCTAGGAKALRSVPSAPHAGQNLGPVASMPWITSVRSPQLEHR